MRLLSYLGVLIIVIKLSTIDAIRKEYQQNMMEDNDGMKIITENSHSKKNKLSNTLFIDSQPTKKEFFDQKQIFNYFSQNNIKKKDDSEENDQEEEKNEEASQEEEDKEENHEEEKSEEEEQKVEGEDKKEKEKSKDKKNKEESKDQQQQPQQKQLVISIKDSDNQIIQQEDGEIYFVRYDPVTQTTQMMNMNKIKEVDFKDSKLTIDPSMSEKPKLEKYTIPSYEPFEWYQVLTEGDIPQRRGGHTITAVGQSVILFGGCQLDVQCFNDLYFYDIMELTWSKTKMYGEPPSPRSGHSATLVGSYLYIFGGSNQHGILSDLHRLNLANRIWEQYEFEGQKPSGRTNHKAVLDNQGRIVIFGGFTVQGYSNDVYFLDLVNMRWVKPLINGDAPRPRENFSMNLVRDSYIWIFGGYALGGETNDLWQLDVENMRWSRILQSFGTKPIERQGHQMILHGKLLYTLGGCNYKEQRCFNDVYQLNVDDLTWTKLDFVLENTLKERDNYGLALMGTNMFVFGGCHMMEKCYNDFLVMNITDICPKNCSGRGTCRNNRCQCHDGFFGEQCEIEMKCEYNCSNRGICGTDGNCKCYRGFAGKICELYVPCPSNCTSVENGLCESNGTCLCNEGYKGLACEMGLKGLLDVEIKCANKCNGHGKCNEETGICICDDGYGDLDCSLTVEEWEQKKKDEIEKKKQEEEEKKKKLEEEKKKKEGSGDESAKKGEEKKEEGAEPSKEEVKEGEKKPEEQVEQPPEEAQAQSKQPAEGGELKAEETPKEENQSEVKIEGETSVVNTEETSELQESNQQSLSKSEEIAKLIHMSLTSYQQKQELNSLSDCENNCSFNGVCSNKECYCKPGFTGQDCSAYKISHLHKGIKATKLFFYVPVFLIIGIIIGYFYLKQAQEAKEEQEFGEIEDPLEEKRESILDNQNNQQSLIKHAYVEDGLEEQDSVSFIKQRDSSKSGSSISEVQHIDQEVAQQPNIFIRNPNNQENQQNVNQQED